MKPKATAILLTHLRLARGNEHPHITPVSYLIPCRRQDVFISHLELGISSSSFGVSPYPARGQQRARDELHYSMLVYSVS